MLQLKSDDECVGDKDTVSQDIVSPCVVDNFPFDLNRSVVSL